MLLNRIEAELDPLIWMVGLNLALTVVIVSKLFLTANWGRSALGLLIGHQ